MSAPAGWPSYAAQEFEQDPVPGDGGAGQRRDLLIVFGWFAVAGLVAGLLWWLLAPAPEWVRTEQNATLDEVSMGQSIGIDGWYAVLAASFGLVSGVVLAFWRWRRPVTVVLLIAAGACLAAGLMYLTGHLLGTGDLDAALREAAVGEGVPEELTPRAMGVLVLWPVTALLGTLGVLWGFTPRSSG